MAERHYNEEEVKALLGRAAEKQRARRAESSLTRGLTLDELADAAAEAGLDPALLREAAAEMEAKGRAPVREADAKHIYVERRLPGTLTREAWGDVSTFLETRLPVELKGILGDQTAHYRRNEQAERASAWWHRRDTAGLETRAEAREDDGQIVVRMSQQVGLLSPRGDALLVGSVLGILVGVVAMIMLKNPGLGLVAALLTILVSAPLTHTLDRAWRGKKHRELEALSEEVATIIGESQPAPEPRAAIADAMPEAPAADARLGMDMLDDALGDEQDAAGPTPARRRTRRSR